jgi:hypothetical protein
VADGHAQAVFTIAAGCPDLELSLVSYDHRGRLVDSDTGVFGAGDHQLAVDVPACGYEVDFLLGTVEEGRLIDDDKGAKGSCAAAGPSTPVVETASATGAPVVAATTVEPAAAVAVPVGVDVLGLQLGTAGTPSPVVLGRPTEVLGVQLERAPDSAAAPAGLARTGSTLLPLTGLGLALCLVGVALNGGKLRRRDVVVCIAERLNGV